MTNPIIPQYAPHFDHEEAQALSDYLQTGPWLTEYRQTRQLEDAICSWTHSPHCVMVPNATLALVAAYYVLGVQPGTEVICPALTQQATATAATLLGATVRFVDVDPDTLCLDVRATMSAVNERTRVISLVYFNGRAPDTASLSALRTLSQSSSIPVVEDAAQALGTRLAQGHPGTLFTIGVVSFSPPKIISTGQGGCLLTDNDILANAIRSFKDFGRHPDDSDKPGWTSFHVPLGFGINLKYTDLQAVVGLVQMQKLSSRVGRKKWVYQRYRERLEKILEVHLLPTDLSTITPWMVDIYVEDRDELAAHLSSVGIGTRPFYPPVPSTGPYVDEWHVAQFPVTERASKEGLWLPCSPEIKDHEVEQVCAAIRGYYRDR